MDRNIKHIEDSIVIDTLLADKTLNFIAFVISPWHVISLEASLLYLRALGMDMKGIVCIIKHPKTGYAVNIEDLVLDEVAMVAFTENAYLYPHRKPTMSQWQVFLSHRKQNLNIYGHVLLGGVRWSEKQRTIFLMNPWKINYAVGLRLWKNGCFVRYVTFDEGVGNYILPESSTYYWSNLHSIRECKTFFTHYVLCEVGIPYFHHVINTCAFSKHNGVGCSLNSRLAPFYQRAICLHGASVCFPYDLSHKIVICTSVLYDNVFADDEDIRVWKEICNALHKVGFQLLLKTHPRDTYFETLAEELHCVVLAGHQTIEDLCSYSKPIAVIAHHSTALVTVSAFFSVLSICITDLFDRRKISSDFLSGIDLYKQTFSSFVSFPKDTDECIKMLLDEKQRHIRK